jgi:hypothetical protein
MHTSTRIEFAVMGLKPDGTWRTLKGRLYDAVHAQDFLGQYISDAKRYPKIYTDYADYKIARRVVKTTFTEWEDI